VRKVRDACQLRGVVAYLCVSIFNIRWWQELDRFPLEKHLRARVSRRRKTAANVRGGAQLLFTIANESQGNWLPRGADEETPRRLTHSSHRLTDE